MPAREPVAQSREGNAGMTKGRTVATAMIGATALLLSLMPTAHAAQCGNSAGRLRGLEAGIRRGGAEARASAPDRISALMQTNYASATIDADRSQRSFQSFARSVPRQARRHHHRRARPFAEAVAGRAVRLDPAALRRAAGAADRDLGHGDRFRQPARQPEHAVVDRDAGL